MNLAREEILTKLKTAPRKQASPRPATPALNEVALKGEELVAKFIQEVTAQTDTVHRAKNKHGILSRLAAIFKKKRISTIMASNDDVVRTLDLAAWGKKNSIKVKTALDFKDRDPYVNAVFDEAEAGITGIDFAVAESGTLGLIHNKEQPRLISLAPIHHIAIVPLDRLVPVYENITDNLYIKNKNAPTHVTFISGPSRSSDIKATPFKGMHGPKRLEIILIG
ncbi:MAG: LUD domain-containing protein [Desulfobacterales bacterium]|jgi:L-lactate dehydrogenase complex protein LldG